MNNDLISRSALKEAINDNGCRHSHYFDIFDVIDNAPTVEVPENAVNCVLTMFGKCSYNKTGCSDCEIKDKIRKALEERPQGEWIFRQGVTAGGYYKCNKCGEVERAEKNFCSNCGASMKKGGVK